MGRSIRLGLAIFVFGGAGLALWTYQGTRPTELGQKSYVRFKPNTTLGDALRVLEEKGILRSASAARFGAWLTRRDQPLLGGIYLFEPGQTAFTRLRELRHPLHRNLRLPATNFALRTSRLLEKYEVCSSGDYMSLFQNPSQFQETFPFLKGATTLEGFLYPATYDLPPTAGADETVDTQLKSFKVEIWDRFGQPKDLNRLLTIASMVELEVKFDDERAIVAGVIENRLKAGMPLQIDASINYGLQEWRPVKKSEYHSFESPYNLYLHKGLPPTPICSPSIASVEAAMHPAKHKYFYYVATLDGRSHFAEDYDAHLKNVRLLRGQLAARKAIKTALGETP